MTWRQGRDGRVTAVTTSSHGNKVKGLSPVTSVVFSPRSLPLPSSLVFPFRVSSYPFLVFSSSESLPLFSSSFFVFLSHPFFLPLSFLLFISLLSQLLIDSILSSSFSVFLFFLLLSLFFFFFFFPPFPPPSLASCLSSSTSLRLSPSSLASCLSFSYFSPLASYLSSSSFPPPSSPSTCLVSLLLPHPLLLSRVSPPILFPPLLFPRRPVTEPQAQPASNPRVIYLRVLIPRILQLHPDETVAEPSLSVWLRTVLLSDQSYLSISFYATYQASVIIIEAPL